MHTDRSIHIKEHLGNKLWNYFFQNRHGQSAFIISSLTRPAEQYIIKGVSSPRRQREGMQFPLLVAKCKNSTRVSYKLLCAYGSDLSRVLLAFLPASRLPEYEGNGAKTLSSSISARYLFNHSLYLVTSYISPSSSSRHLQRLDMPVWKPRVRIL